MKTVLVTGTPMILSGMASSSVGILELAYGRFPFTWNPSMLTVEKFDPDELFLFPLFLVSGLRTETDVMRGEETMLLGYDVNPVGKQVLIFPGTHSKHVWVKDGVATHFKTFTTGEVFNLLVQHSILSNSVEQGDDWESFEGGVNAALDDDFLHGIFKVRTRQLLQGTSRTSNYQYLSGLLIGLELKGLQGCPDSIAVISEDPLTGLYCRASRVLGLQNQTITVRAQDTLINGHIKIASSIL
jgi:2-dehydro-3-deoxygalactonokinase